MKISPATIPHVTTKSTRMSWRWMIKNWNLKLYSGRQHGAYRDAKIVKSWKGKYVRDEDTSFDPPHKFTTDAIGFHPDGSLMFLFLKKVIPPGVQNEALMGLQKMKFKSTDKSNRKELKGANVFNLNLIRDDYDRPVPYPGKVTGGAGELNYGFYARHKIDQFTPTKKQNQAFVQCFSLLTYMSHVFANRLPRKFMEQNVGTPEEFRLAGFTPFSSVAILKSAPSAVHTDGRNGNNFACMTSVEDPDDPYDGGAFCFVEFGVQIAVKPGDLLIASTPRDWHANLTPVKGTKYSIVCYFKKVLTHARLLANYRAINS
jgi:hypothetical protein